MRPDCYRVPGKGSLRHPEEVVFRPFDSPGESTPDRVAVLDTFEQVQDIPLTPDKLALKTRDPECGAFNLSEDSVQASRT